MRRLGNEASDLQALADAGNIEHFLKSEGGTFLSYFSRS